MAFFIGNDAALRRLNLSTGEVQLVFPTINEFVTAIDLDEPKGVLYAAMEYGVRVVDTSSMRVIASWPSVPNATAVALVPEQDIAFVVSQNHLTVVHLGSGAVVARDEDVTIVAGYGNYLATNGRDPVAVFVDGSSWIRLASLTSIPAAPPSRVRAAAVEAGLQVSWRRPTFLGQPRATRYRVHVNGSQVGCTSTRTSCIIKGLRPGRTYRLHVTAQSPQTQSLPSSVVTTRIKRPAVASQALPSSAPTKPGQQLRYNAKGLIASSMPLWGMLVAGSGHGRCQLVVPSLHSRW